MTRRSPGDTRLARFLRWRSRTAVRTALALDSIVFGRAGAEHLAHRARARAPRPEIH